MGDWRLIAVAVYISMTLAMSVVIIAMMWWDKRQARKDKWRISENRLHLIELLGGWPGSFLARRWLHHKTVKLKYRLVYGAIVTMHVLVVAGIVYLFVN